MIDAPPPAIDLVRFWQDAGRERWFTHDAGFDDACRSRFGCLYDEAAAERLPAWEATPTGALALVLLLDQIPRNIFRGDPRTWATDRLALEVSGRALQREYDREVPEALRTFFFLPLTHSERLVDQDRSVALYEGIGDVDGVVWARHHRDIIARFGRFPHRNAVLGRDNTPEEDIFLATETFRG